MTKEGNVRVYSKLMAYKNDSERQWLFESFINAIRQ